jgi:hypothetical protein
MSRSLCCFLHVCIQCLCYDLGLSREFFFRGLSARQVGAASMRVDNRELHRQLIWLLGSYLPVSSYLNSSS